MKILRTNQNNLLSEQDLATVSDLIAAGGVVVFPTETVYGLAARVDNAKAIDTLFKFKNRPAGKVISMLVPTITRLWDYLQRSDLAVQLAERFLPGPVTLVGYPQPGAALNLDARLLSEQGLLGIRVSSHPLAQQLSEVLDFPITATSANLSGQANTYDAATWIASLPSTKQDLIAAVIDAGVLPQNPPSTVIDTTQDLPQTLRAGSIPLAELANKQMYTSTSVAETKAIGAQIAGQLLSAAQTSGRAQILCLRGELGAGKTQLVAGMAAALGVRDVVNSPTFSLLKEYRIENPHRGLLYHLDLWRLEQQQLALAELGVELENTTQGAIICCVEWPDKLIPDASVDSHDLFIFKKDEHTRVLYY